MTAPAGKVLVLAWGNAVRGDDGLGPALAAALQRDLPPGTSVRCRHQLRPDDAELVARYEAVIFVDADRCCAEPFRFERLQPRPSASAGAHGLTVELLLALAEKLYGRRVPGYVLAVRGYRFDVFDASLSPRAAGNLERALVFLVRALAERRFDAYAEQGGSDRE